jgi:hypothetical protein
MKKIFLALICALSMAGFMYGHDVARAQSLPSFPMTFWGNVTIDGNAAPAGTVIRAYYGTSTLAGSVTVQEAGIYGYDQSTKQKLVASAGDGVITFSFQATSLNGGQETRGTSLQTYSGFETGNAKNIDLAFTSPAQDNASAQSAGGGTPAPVSSGGGGGGGGGGSYFPPTVPTSTQTSSIGEVLGASTSDPLSLLQLINSLLVQLKGLQKQLVTKQIKAAGCAFVFNINFSQGSNNESVRNLQKVLNYSSLTQIAAGGAGSPGNESTYFGAGTKKALINFQNIFSDEILTPAGLTSGNGSVGLATRAQLNKLCSN